MAHFTKRMILTWMTCKSEGDGTLAEVVFILVRI
jgi:hypothetical protein